MTKPTSIFENRPDEVKRVHYACDGSIELINLVPSHFIRVGDTASGKLPGRSDERYLWKSVASTTVAGVQGSIAWEPVEPWNEQRGAEYIKACDLLCAVPIGREV